MADHRRACAFGKGQVRCQIARRRGLRITMRIWIVGKNGQVGWELQRTLSGIGECVAVDHPQIDLVSEDSIRKVIADTSPELIVNAAAYTAVGEAEDEFDLAMKINGVAPGI